MWLLTDDGECSGRRHGADELYEKTADDDDGHGSGKLDGQRRRGDEYRKQDDCNADSGTEHHDAVVQQTTPQADMIAGAVVGCGDKRQR